MVGLAHHGRGYGEVPKYGQYVHIWAVLCLDVKTCPNMDKMTSLTHDHYSYGYYYAMSLSPEYFTLPVGGHDVGCRRTLRFGTS